MAHDLACKDTEIFLLSKALKAAALQNSICLQSFLSRSLTLDYLPSYRHVEHTVMMIVKVILLSTLCFLETTCAASIPNTKSIKIEKVAGPVELGEGPHWDARSQTLYYVDLLDGHKIVRYDPATKRRTYAILGVDFVGAVVPVEGTTDKLIAAVDKKVVVVTWDGERNVNNPPMKVLASLDTNRDDTRVNDGKCDPAGRFWIGTMAIEVNKYITPDRGSLYRIDTDGKVNNVVSPISIGNGLAWSPENDVMYYIDSPAYQVWAFDYNNADGTLSNKRVIFDVKENNIEGLPDGMTNDADGNLWVALHGGQAILQIDPKEGKLLQKIELPTDQITSAAFGGPALDELYVTTSRYGKSTEERQQKPDAGSLYRITGLGIKGLLGNNCKINV